MEYWSNGAKAYTRSNESVTRTGEEQTVFVSPRIQHSNTPSWRGVAEGEDGYSRTPAHHANQTAPLRGEPKALPFG
jgi:hypothetical protein